MLITRREFLAAGGGVAAWCALGRYRTAGAFSAAFGHSLGGQVADQCAQKKLTAPLSV
jgi:hypothetical protein